MIAWIAAAAAQDRSLDIELVHPRVTDDPIVGVDTLGDAVGRQGHAGVFLSYTHDPLLVVGENQVVSAVERNRLSVDVGGAWQFTPGLALRVGVPVLADWGTQSTDLAAEGVGLGDLWVGGVAASPRLGPVRGGISIDGVISMGTKDAWRGERSSRLVPGVLLDFRLGRLTVAANGAVVVRSPVDTDTGLTVGTELLANGGIGWEFWKDHARLTASAVTRTGLTSDGPGSDAYEVIGGMSVDPNPRLRVEGWVGRGLNLGYGASDYRFGLGATVHARPKPKPKPVPPPEPPPKPPQTVKLDPLDEIPDLAPPEAPEKPAPVPLARMEADQIVIRDPIQFELGNDHILPDSLPILAEVAAILHDHPEILEVVIEGHASEEGSYLYNYELSLKRSSAIFKELVTRGVHPERLACRSYGEVAPVAPGEEESELARNRRVMFRITRRLQPGEAVPPYVRDIRLPWNGYAATIPEGPPVEIPAPPPPPEPEPPKRKSEIPDKKAFQEDDDIDIPTGDPAAPDVPDPDEPEHEEDEP